MINENENEAGIEKQITWIRQKQISNMVTIAAKNFVSCLLFLREIMDN